MRARPRWFCALAVVLVSAGCSSIGPPTINRDRSSYSSAMADSWKEMQLLNIVKYRYYDPPVFLDVPSVVSQQELEARAQATSQLFRHDLTTVSGTQDFYNLEARGQYIDRPTISYTPITGQPFVDLLLRPISPATIFATTDAGYSAAFNIARTSKTINDLRNYSLAAARSHPGDARFREVIAAIDRLQQAGAVAVRTREIDDKPPATAGRAETKSSTTTQSAESRRVASTVYFRRHVNPAAERDIRLVKSLLGLDPRRDEFRLTGGPRHTPEEIAVTSRSMKEILDEFAAGVDVPVEDVAAGRATSVPAIAENPESPPLIHIHSGPAAPVDAYSAVYYQGHWFWVDNDDLPSKLDFLFLLLFYALSQTHSVPLTPLVTISAGQ
jgi:hypothetical protein